MPVAEFPTWVLLEPFVLRRDDDESFPDKSKAPIRATGTTSWGATFRIAFSLAEPPRISRLYAQLPVPGFLDRSVAKPLSIVATHHHLALVRVANQTPKLLYQNFFIFTAADDFSSLKQLPLCTEPEFHFSKARDHPPFRRRDPHDASPRLLDVFALGLWCQGGEFVVAEMTPYKPARRAKAFADICLLRSYCPSDLDKRDQLAGSWESMRVEFMSAKDPEDPALWQICCWYTDAVIPFRNWLCWIDYHRGIIFCDVSKRGTPTVSFMWLPVSQLPSTNTRTATSSFYYRAVSVVNSQYGHVLKFINITRHDGIPFGALTPGTGFTISCHTLLFLSDGSMGWEEDYTVNSSELWKANGPERLPRRILMFPQVDMDRPQVAHFLIIEFGCANKNMWVVTIDMSTKIVESFSLFINGKDGLRTDDADLIKQKSGAPKPFLPCEFPQYLNISRKRKRSD